MNRSVKIHGRGIINKLTVATIFDRLRYFSQDPSYMHYGICEVFQKNVTK